MARVAQLAKRFSEGTSFLPASCTADVVGGEGAGGASFLFRRWVTKKAGGSTQNGRDSKPENLGVKKYGVQDFNTSVKIEALVEIAPSENRG